MMTGKTINELPEIFEITQDAEFVVEQLDTTYKIKTLNITSGFAKGSFYSTETQSITGTTEQPYLMYTEVTDFAQGISVVDNTKFTVESGGTYNLIFSVQMDKSSYGSPSLISIWIRINGEDIEWSAGEVITPPTVVGARIILGWNYLYTLNAGDYMELVWYSNNAATIIEATPRNEELGIPAVPSVAVTITQV
jgi:hypothetical protein